MKPTSYASLFGISKKAELEKIIRVDLAGEMGAKVIYSGQIFALKNDQEIYTMYKDELPHLDYFQELARKHQVSPTFLNPIWMVWGFLLGYIPAKISKKLAMITTEGIENVISQHYTSQIEVVNLLKFEDYKSILQNLEKFKQEEESHEEKAKSSAINHKKFEKYFLEAIKLGTRIIIEISK